MASRFVFTWRAVLKHLLITGLLFKSTVGVKFSTPSSFSSSEFDEDVSIPLTDSLEEGESRVHLIPVPSDGEEEVDKNEGIELGSEEKSTPGDGFGREDLVELVTELERDSSDDEKEQLIPEIMSFLHVAMKPSESKSGNASSSPTTSVNPVNYDASPVRKQILHRSSFNTNHTQHQPGGESETKLLTDVDVDEDDLDGREEDMDDEDLELALLPRDLSELTEDIADDIAAGVEESIRLFVDEDGSGNKTEGVETRQLLSMYLFQGQYVPESRLNRFIDGALRNMGTEMRISSMDPLYFRVLPRGMVEERGQPLYANNAGVRRRRPQQYARSIVKRQASFKDLFIKKVVGNSKVFNFKRRKQLLLQRKRQQQRLKAQQLSRQRLKNKRLQAQRKKKQNLLQQQKNRRKQQQQQNQRQKLQAKQRIRRRTLQDVGGGRVEGLSRVQRDGDAEMQLFGNYTLIRSHMKIGPVELTMQIRTKNGIKRTGATLPIIRAHTVTRVNHEGSEMVDFLLDRPHPETIKVRGNLFPLAQKIARNIFARLFLPNSFLTEKLREKTGLALWSKPIE